MSVWNRWLPIVVVALCLAYLAGALRPASQQGQFDYELFGRVPVSHNGRIKPVQTVARTSVMVFSGRHAIEHEGETIPATQWFLDTVTKPDVATQYELFRIDHPALQQMLGVTEAERKRFSYAEILPHVRQIAEQAQLASAQRASERTVYQRRVLELAQRLTTYSRLVQLEEPFVVAPLGGTTEWMQFAAAFQEFHQQPQGHPSIDAWRAMLAAYQRGDAATFNSELARYYGLLRYELPQRTWKAYLETLLNRFTPFYHAAVLLVFALVLIVMSWLVWRGPLGRAAVAVILLALLVQTLGMALRIYLQGRPPVTNLYSSAIFIGWGCMILGLVLERLLRNQIGAVLAAVTGFLTLVIAHHLDDTGDTMEMMRAVLDSNFWLATHVIVITAGYSATFLAGALGVAYILAGVFTRAIDSAMSRSIGQAIYGVVAFATVLSFIGTLLGGIWADQSWGRFWGWDPKENGALIIVLWNALILHAKWGGIVRHRGIAVLAVFGNVVTAWSWFGTNMLGVGLHSYGFIDSALFWLIVFVVSQLMIMVVGLTPLAQWRSFAMGAASAVVSPPPWGDADEAPPLEPPLPVNRAASAPET